jgi:hypothetical protein
MKEKRHREERERERRRRDGQASPAVLKIAL